MANKKITELSTLLGSQTTNADVYVVVDMSVPETKKQSRAEFFKNIPPAYFANSLTFNDGGGDHDARFEGETDPNLLFTDASTDRVGIGTNTPTAKLQLFGSLAFKPPVTVTADYTVDEADVFIICNKGSTLTMTLPDPTTSDGRILVIKTIQSVAVNSSTNNVVPRSGGPADNGILSASDGAWVMLVSDGTNWIQMAG